MATTSITLLERLRQPNDKAAWERFVELYTPLIYYWARRSGLQSADAADLAQDVFAALVQQMTDFHYDQRKSFRSWLRTVTLNKWREKQRRRKVTTLQGNDPVLTELSSPEDPEAFTEAEYHQFLTRRALELMKAEFALPTWKACWELVVSGRRAAEVASDLGMSIDSVYSAKSRVLRRLREELADLLY
jgi:RNA polymerase sigma-70 factor (ECF subfamily)